MVVATAATALLAVLATDIHHDLVRELRYAALNPRMDRPLDSLKWLSPSRTLLLLGTVYLGAALTIWLMQLRWCLQALGGPVVVEADELVVTAYPAGKKRARWQEIKEVRVLGRRGKWGRIIDVVATAGVIRVPPLVWGQDALLGQIVERAGLELVRETWLRLVYASRESSEARG